MRHRVLTYITRADQLLILEYVDGRYREPQIPGGTVEAGELTAVPALREAHEEAGLTALKLVKYLGRFERNLAEIGRDETIMAWFFHLHTDEATADSWRHFECDSSEGKEQSFYESDSQAPHPLDDINIFIAGGMGQGLVRRLARKNIISLVTTETDPQTAVLLYLKGELQAEESSTHAGNCQDHKH